MMYNSISLPPELTLPFLHPMNFTENQQGNAVLEKLRQQRETGRFCDVVLVVRDKQYPAHRNILAACSPYFDSILKMHKVVKEQVTVNCQSAEVFELLLNYMYSGSVVIDRSNVTELLKLANNFLVSKLKNYCAEYMDRYLDVTNCLGVKDLADRYNMPSLAKNASAFVASNSGRVAYENDEYLDFSASSLRQFLDEYFGASSSSSCMPGGGAHHFSGGQIASPKSRLACVVRWCARDFDAREEHFASLLAQALDGRKFDQATLANFLDEDLGALIGIPRPPAGSCPSVASASSLLYLLSDEAAATTVAMTSSSSVHQTSLTSSGALMTSSGGLMTSSSSTPLMTPPPPPQTVIMATTPTGTAATTDLMTSSPPSAAVAAPSACRREQILYTLLEAAKTYDLLNHKYETFFRSLAVKRTGDVSVYFNTELSSLNANSATGNGFPNNVVADAAGSESAIASGNYKVDAPLINGIANFVTHDKRVLIDRFNDHTVAHLDSIVVETPDCPSSGLINGNAKDPLNIEAVSDIKSKLHHHHHRRRKITLLQLKHDASAHPGDRRYSAEESTTRFPAEPIYSADRGAEVSYHATVSQNDRQSHNDDLNGSQFQHTTADDYLPPLRIKLTKGVLSAAQTFNSKRSSRNEVPSEAVIIAAPLMATTSSPTSNDGGVGDFASTVVDESTAANVDVASSGSTSFYDAFTNSHFSGGEFDTVVDSNGVVVGSKKRRRGRPPKRLTTSDFAIAADAGGGDGDGDRYDDDDGFQSSRDGAAGGDSPDAASNGDVDAYDDDDEAAADSTPAGRQGRRSTAKLDRVEVVFQCPHCVYKSTCQSRIQSHINRAHSKNLTFTCTLCNYQCKWNREYYMHMKKHFQGPPFYCDMCDYSADRIQMLLTHRMTHTDERPYKCPQCNYKCRTKTNLAAHTRSHTGEKPFTCGECGRGFAIKSTLDQHLATHSESRPFVCDRCPFSTKYQSHLISHRRIHTGDVFHCQFSDCCYSSPKKSQLAAHMRTHLAVRAFQCSVCDRSFVEKSHLVRHERIHLDDKPFKCPSCSYASSRRDKLKEHVFKHHGGGGGAIFRPRRSRSRLGVATRSATASSATAAFVGGVADVIGGFGSTPTMAGAFLTMQSMGGDASLGTTSAFGGVDSDTRCSPAAVIGAFFNEVVGGDADADVKDVLLAGGGDSPQSSSSLLSDPLPSAATPPTESSVLQQQRPNSLPSLGQATAAAVAAAGSFPWSHADFGGFVL